MSEITINYKGNSIATMDASGTKTLLTSGKYCEANLEVVYTRPVIPPSGDNLEYGYTDGSLPLVGVAKVDSAHVWDDQLQMMIFGTGQIGTGRVV